jgi:hypothetical protein
MERWHEVAIGVTVVILASLFFDFRQIPTGAGKMAAYLCAGLLPTLVIQYHKVAKDESPLDTWEFLFALFLNAWMVLFFATFPLLLIDRL